MYLGFRRIPLLARVGSLPLLSVAFADVDVPIASSSLYCAAVVPTLCADTCPDCLPELPGLCKTPLDCLRSVTAIHFCVTCAASTDGYPLLSLRRAIMH